MKNWIKNMILLLGSVFVGLIILEAILHFALPSLPKAEQVKFFRHHSIMGWEKVPNTSGMHVSGEYTSMETINAKGLRGSDYSYEKSGNIIRVLVLGDSFVEAYQVAEENSVTTALERTLNSSGRAFQVINGGTRGYSTDQQLLFFQHEGIKYQPDITVLMFFMNDIWYNTISEVRFPGRPYPVSKPFFRFDKGTINLEGVPVPYHGDEIALSASLSMKEQLKLWLREHSQTYNVLAQAIKGSTTLYSVAVRLGLAKPTQFGSLAGANRPTVPDVYRVWRKAPDLDVEKAWRLTEEIILAMEHKANEVGSDFLIFYIPSIVEVKKQYWEDTLLKYQIEASEWSADLPRQRLRHFCEQHGIPIIDPIDRFRDRVAKGDQLYFVTDRHWTKTGHQIAAELIADELEHLLHDKPVDSASEGRCSDENEICYN